MIVLGSFGPSAFARISVYWFYFLYCCFRPKQEEQLTLGAQKKVTFDSNVKEYVHISYDEAPELIQEIEKDNEKVIDVKCTEPGKCSTPSESGSTLSSLGSYPPNHRYENCRESDDEAEELDCEVSDLDEDEDVYNDDVDEEERYDAGYSDDEYPRQVQESPTRSGSSLESGAKNSVVRVANDRHGGESIVDHGSLYKDLETPPGFYRGARDRSGYVHSVLNPVENTTQWKTVKSKQTPQLRQQKENSQINDPGNNHPLAVDTSLSTWLISSQKTPPSKDKPSDLDPISCWTSASSYGSNSVTSHQERPIFGALTVEELKQLSASSPPRRSPCRGPNEKPLVGTVGVHWNNGSDRTPVESSGSASSFKGIPNTTSKYREVSIK